MVKANQRTKTVAVERRVPQNRRKQVERRTAEVAAAPVVVERRQSERRKVERRRQIDPTTCERDYTDDEIAFMTAMDEYKRKSGRQFPTWSEVLEVVRNLGYRRVAEPTEIYPAGNR